MSTPIDLGSMSPPQSNILPDNLPTTTSSEELPVSIILTPIEEKIVIAAAKGSTTKNISNTLGLPVGAVNKVLNRKDVKEYINEMVEVRNDAIKNYLPGLLMDIIEDKIQKAKDEDVRLADTSRKDIVEIAKQLSDIVKTSDASTGPVDAFTNIYQQINNIQSK